MAANGTSAASAAQVNADSLHSDASGLILFDLTTKRGSKHLFSPHTTKTILDLKLLNIGCDRQRLTFKQIRTDLASRVVENVTVPTLELSDGSHLTDSWTIAEYLEANHPQGSLLFAGSTSVKSLAAYINDFCVKGLRPHFSCLFLPKIPTLLDDESREYFINEKVGKAKFEQVKAGLNDKTAVEGHIAQLKTLLSPIGTMLSTKPALDPATKSAAPKDGKRWLAGTEHPSHADFCLFGWYVYSRTDPKLSDELWSSTPALAKWVKDMREWCGEDFLKDLVE